MIDNSSVEIHDLVHQFIINEFIYDPDSIAKLGDETSLIDENFLDSLGVHTLIVFLEERFAISVLDEDATRNNFGTINSIVAYVRCKLGYSAQDAGVSPLVESREICAE
jgi:acyl carrier protein